MQAGELHLRVAYRTQRGAGCRRDRREPGPDGVELEAERLAAVGQGLEYHRGESRRNAEGQEEIATRRLGRPDGRAGCRVRGHVRQDPAAGGRPAIRQAGAPPDLPLAHGVGILLGRRLPRRVLSCSPYAVAHSSLRPSSRSPPVSRADRDDRRGQQPDRTGAPGGMDAAVRRRHHPGLARVPEAGHARRVAGGGRGAHPRRPRPATSSPSDQFTGLRAGARVEGRARREQRHLLPGHRGGGGGLPHRARDAGPR